MTIQIMLELKLLLLVIVANSAPVLADKLLDGRWQAAIDGGRMLADERPLFGVSKTWRGIVAAVLLTTLTAPLIGLPIMLGLLFGVLSMLGDLLSSFIKRRLGKAPSSQALLLDQLPEALLPLIAGRCLLDYSWVAVMAIALVFVLSEMLLSPLLYKMGIRKSPF